MSVSGPVQRSRRPYLLIDQKLIIPFFVLVGKIFLDLPQITPLLKELSVDAQLLSFGEFSLSDKSKKLPCLFELFPQLLEFLYALGVSAASFANLSDLSSSETDIGITIISVRSSSELWRRKSGMLVSSCEVIYLQARR